MGDIASLILRVRADLAEGDRLSAELGVDDSDFAEVRRPDVEALLEIASRYDEHRPGWTAVPDAVMAGMRGGGRA